MANEIGIKRNLLFKEGHYVISSLDLKLEAEVSKFNKRFEEVKTATKIQDEIR